MAEADGALWYDSAKLIFLSGVINNKLRRALIPVILLKTYPEWVRRVTEVSYKLEAYNPR